jgi:hypothetical protein
VLDGVVIPLVITQSPAFCVAENKKADVAEYPRVFGHVGLLINERPGTAGLLFI